MTLTSGPYVNERDVGGVTVGPLALPYTPEDETSGRRPVVRKTGGVREKKHRTF